LPFDSPSLKRMTLVKQLYQRGLDQSRSLKTVDKIISVVLFDLAIETALKAVIAALEPGKNPPRDYPQTFSDAESLMTKVNQQSLPYKAEISNVHTVRNGVQHRATTPEDSVVNDCRTYTRDFLHAICNVIWNEPFDAISLASLIQHPEVKLALTDAESYLAQQQYAKAAKSAAAALAYALELVTRAIVGPYLFRKAENKDYVDGLNRLRDITLYLTLGLNYSEYMRYLSIVGHVFRFSPEVKAPIVDYYNTVDIENDIDPKAAEFAVSYCINAIIQVENIVGDLKEPFGRNNWH
jgi:hypothetical protein